MGGVEQVESLKPVFNAARLAKPARRRVLGQRHVHVDQAGPSQHVSPRRPKEAFGRQRERAGVEPEVRGSHRRACRDVIATA